MKLPVSLATDALARLARFPRLTLGQGPTPIQRLDRVSAQLQGPQIWIKRDDCTGLATGGNKTRKLEFLVADALANGCDTLISQGALQSNHARQVAAAGAAAGLKVHLVLSDAVPGRTQDYARVGNIQLCRLLGAKVEVISDEIDADAYCADIAWRLQGQGARPYVIAMGGSDGMGALGYVQAFAEIMAQTQAMDVPLDAMVLATGSGGTQAGLMLGAHLHCWQGRIHGVSVSPDAALAQQRISKSLLGAAALLELEKSHVQDVPMHIDVDHKGPHYGVPSADTVAAVTLLAQQEGILLDPVYSGKAFAGLLAACAPGGVLHAARHVLFVHTGGTAALSAYPEVGAEA